MKNIGITRKIDELGRIVIPIEIRKNLNINNGDDIEISIDKNQIVMQKYSKIADYKEESNNLLTLFNDIIDAQIYITDKDKVITKGSIENSELPLRIINCLNERKKYESHCKEELYFDNKLIEGYFLVLPIIDNSDAIGSVIIVKPLAIEQEDRVFAYVIKNIIENHKNLC